MRLWELPVTCANRELPTRDDAFEALLAPSMSKASLSQSHCLMRPASRAALLCSLDLAGALVSWKKTFERHRLELALPEDRFPYGLSPDPWWRYCAAPHSYLDLGSGSSQVGLNFLDRFLHLNWRSRSAHLLDPGVGDELLSTTNWFDRQTGTLWFASWPGRDTLRREIDPGAPVQARVWKLSLPGGRLERVWSGELGDSLHQVAVSPDRRFLLVTELGLRTAARAAAPEGPDPAQGPNLAPSRILVLALETGDEWRLSLPAAGHLEFDPEHPDLCYLSGHNINLSGAGVGILGAGCIQKLRLTRRGPELLGEYTAPGFHRITTHTLFKHRGRTLIAVSGYPRRVFLIDAATMELFAVLEQETGERVDTAQAPHYCRQDSYGVAPTPDGESLVLSGTGFLQRLDLARRRFAPAVAFASGGDGSGFTGHLGRLDAGGEAGP